MYDGRFYTIGEGHKEFAADKQTVGIMSIPDEKEIQAMMEEMENHPKTLKYVS